MGVVFLSERPEPRHFPALALILGGVLRVQLEPPQARRLVEPSEEAKSAA
jgi:hypothetical protein